MKNTFKAKQEIEFKIPEFPKAVITSAGSIPIENLSEDVIAGIFDSMKQNALEYVAEKNKVTPVDLSKAAAGKNLAKNLG